MEIAGSPAPRSYADVVVAHAPALLRLAVMLTGDRQDAEDLPDAEIAELLGCSQDTVRSHAFRGLAALRSHLMAEETR